ncbi:hypothetical protein CPC08DRAFT_807423 [Agrocybe pediades]|nr:hypothetical protein CPC08DRAFT_807423 [Agrocybe pediades]
MFAGILQFTDIAWVVGMFADILGTSVVFNAFYRNVCILLFLRCHTPAFLESLSTSTFHSFKVWRCFHASGRTLAGFVLPLVLFGGECALVITSVVLNSLIDARNEQIARIANRINGAMYALIAATSITATFIICKNIYTHTTHNRSARKRFYREQLAARVGTATPRRLLVRFTAFSQMGKPVHNFWRARFTALNPRFTKPFTTFGAYENSVADFSCGNTPFPVMSSLPSFSYTISAYLTTSAPTLCPPPNHPGRQRDPSTERHNESETATQQERHSKSQRRREGQAEGQEERQAQRDEKDKTTTTTTCEEPKQELADPISDDDNETAACLALQPSHFPRLLNLDLLDETTM